MTSEQELIRQFQDVTGADSTTSRFWLESCGWKVELATTSFFDSGGARGAADAPPAKPVPQVVNPSNKRKGVMGFSDLGGAEPEKAQNYFTGGKSSGVMVQDPQKDEGDIASRLLDTAKRNMGQVPPSSTPGEGLLTRKLVFWKQGFTVDDNELRRYDDPANKAFLEAVNRGVAPPELAAEGQEIDLHIVDNKGEDYKPPPPVLKPFSGAGHSLGGGSSTTTTTTAPVRKERPPLVVDMSAPVTSIQIRLHDGTRLVAKFNHNHTVGDIRGFVDKALPVRVNYQLQTTFPVKVLVDEEQTIAAAGLLNAVIVQQKI